MGYLSKICNVRFRKKTARVILDKDINTRSHILFSELRWMPLTERIDYHRSTQVYKCLNNKDISWNKIPDYIKTASSLTSFKKLYSEQYFGSKLNENEMK